ncbi:MAG: GNAT family N-acetyltransferase [Labilithrix sp.]|nr:GNAT family N-acetyltransferase [Labilithrix sp.]
MRKAIYRAGDDEGRALLGRAPAIHLAMVSASGEPILRTFNGVVVDDVVAFHGAPAGEKMEGVGRAVVVSAEETVVSIPSYFLDPRRACPATTYYVAAQAHGVLEEVADVDRKAAILSALMAKYQPEGGHVPIAADHPLYRKAVAGLFVAQVRLDRVTCKAKLGQNRSPEERVRILEQLWRRGAPGDVRAIALLRDRFPELPAPSFLETSSGVTLHVGVGEGRIDEAVDLLARLYWLEGISTETIRASILGSTAVVSARDDRGRIVAFARAVSDGKCAWIYDVVVDAALRSRGLGSTLMTLLLDHPGVRGARHVRLTTRDAMSFYRRLGFRELAEAPRHAWRSIEMIRSERAAEADPAGAVTDDRHDVGLVGGR